MNLGFENKVIIVSGGARGIGEGIVKTLLEEKAIPVVIDLRPSTIQGVTTINADLTHPEACKKAIQQIVEQFGTIHGLVNNAGVNDGVNLEQGNYESFMQSIHKNLVHYYLLAHHALPYLKTNKGSIVNISSKTAETGQGGTSAKSKTGNKANRNMSFFMTDGFF